MECRKGKLQKKIGCSPDTVKRRIWEVQYKMEMKEGEESIEKYDNYDDDDYYDDYYEGFNLDTKHDDYDDERIDSDSEHYGNYWGLSNDVNDLFKQDG